MLRTISSNLSIITNFGCERNCWYCIWKNHQLRYTYKPTDWDKIRNFLNYNYIKRLSVSGGGDCLYNYDKNLNWWINLFEIKKEFDLYLSIHTRKMIYNKSFLSKIDKYVYSFDKIEEIDRKYLNFLMNLGLNIRLVNVPNKFSKMSDIEKMISIRKDLNIQFTIKKLVGFKDNDIYNKLKKKYPKEYFLDEGDYNIYFMPDNKIYNSFCWKFVKIK